MFIEEFQKIVKKTSYTFNNEQLMQLERFYDLLIEWNKKINLTAITEPKDFIIKHIIDSVSIWDNKKFAETENIIDIGTGAGFPGIPLKIYKPDKKIVLLDSLDKRIRFLQTVTKKLEFKDIFLIHSRAEDAAHNFELRENFDLCVSRAVAKLNVLAEYCLPFVKVGGYFVAMKGASIDNELKEAERSIDILGGSNIECNNIKLPNGDNRNLIYIKKFSNSPNKFPRKAGIPDKKPLI